MLSWRYRYQKGNELKTYDIDKLKDPKTVRKYVNTLTAKAGCDEHTAKINNGNWTTCKQINTKAVDEVIKEEGRRQRNDWFGEECKEVTQRKNAAYKEMIRKHYTKKKT